MSEAVAPAVTANEQTTGPIVVETSNATRNEPINAIAELARRHAERTAQEAEGEPEGDAPAAEPTPAEEPAEPADKGAALRHARTLRDLTRAQGELVQLRKSLAEFQSFKSVTEADFKANPLKAMEKLAGRPFHEIMTEATQGKFDIRDNVDPEVRKQLDELRSFKQQQEQSKADAQKAEQRTADLATIDQVLADAIDELPFVFGLPWGKEDLLEAAYKHLETTGEQPDLKALAAEQNREALEGASKIMTPQVLRSLAADPTVRAAMQAALGGKAGPAARQAPKPAGNLRPVVTNEQTQTAPKPAAETRKLTPWELQQQEEAEMAARFAQFKKTNGGRLI